MSFAPDSEDVERIDRVLSTWRQGDVALDEQAFVHLGKSDQPLTEACARVARSRLASWIGRWRRRPLKSGGERAGAVSLGMRFDSHGRGTSWS
jgi:hypothetical protein